MTDRKRYPICTGVLDYFPDALLAVAEVSQRATEQHHPGSPMHWDRAKSTDEVDALLRHLIQRGTKDTDGIRHSAKVAWRALAALQKELEEQEGRELSRASRRTEENKGLYKQAGSAAQVVSGLLYAYCHSCRDFHHVQCPNRPDSPCTPASTV